MVKPKILNEEPISMIEVKTELAGIKKKGDLNFRAERTGEYINQFAVLDTKKAKELQEKLESLSIPRLKPQHILKIVDLTPTTADDVKVILQGYTLTVSADNMKKIASAVAEFV